MSDENQGLESKVEKSSSGSSNCSFSRKPPKCALCLNHRQKVAVKDHKRDCPFLICVCDKCTGTKERRKQMAERQAKQRDKLRKERKGSSINNNSNLQFIEPISKSIGNIKNTNTLEDCKVFNHCDCFLRREITTRVPAVTTVTSPTTTYVDCIGK